MKGSNRVGVAKKFIVNLLRFQGEMGLERIDKVLRKEDSIAYKGGYGYKNTRKHLEKLKDLGYICIKEIPVPERRSREKDGIYRLYYARKPIDKLISSFYIYIETDKRGNLLPFPRD